MRGEWNGRHSWHPIILGISEPAYSDEQLKEFRENSNEVIEIDGKEKTRYEWSQEMRRLETKIREEKEAQYAEKQSNVTTKDSATNIKGFLEKYDKIASKTGIEPVYTRTKFTSPKAAEKLTNGVKNGIINIEGYRKLQAYDLDNNVDVNVPDEVFSIVNRVSKAIEKDFPMLDNYLAAIGFGECGEGNPAMACFAIDEKTGYVGQVLALNKDMWNDLDKLKRFVKEQSDSNGHIKTNDVGAIISHEYGHFMHNTLILRLAGYNPYVGLSLSQMESLRSFRELINIKISNIREKYNISLSERADDNIDEYIAEAFSDFYSGSRSEQSIEVVDYVIRGIKNGIL